MDSAQHPISKLYYQDDMIKAVYPCCEMFRIWGEAEPHPGILNVLQKNAKKDGISISGSRSTMYLISKNEMTQTRHTLQKCNTNCIIEPNSMKEDTIGKS